MTIDVADIALLRRNHRSDDAFLQRCYTCYQKWPCITSELLDAYEERDRLRAALEAIEGAISLTRPSLFNQSLSNIARAALEGRE